ncbi:hypothetical protein BD289DRAFT_143533 [Coniella lustricola]|uniref:Uncharacterized protein n=1 Tax=Coniella lustricola TaxID=2025994 RepID=A0A2T3AEU8_9PEZI|nr:hypothetical protein BD289DRAFT_143533 [Coniella lustricola]
MQQEHGARRRSGRARLIDGGTRREGSRWKSTDVPGQDGGKGVCVIGRIAVGGSSGRGRGTGRSRAGRGAAGGQGRRWRCRVWARQMAGWLAGGADGGSTGAFCEDGRVAGCWVKDAMQGWRRRSGATESVARQVTEVVVCVEREKREREREDGGGGVVGKDRASKCVCVDCRAGEKLGSLFQSVEGSRWPLGAPASGPIQWCRGAGEAWVRPG